MDRLIHTAVSGLNSSMVRQRMIASNMANAQTIGFRAEVMRHTPTTIDGASLQVRAMARSDVHGALMKPGAMIRTGRELDVALAGDALLTASKPLEAERLYAAAAAVRMPEGLFLRRIEALSQAGRGAEAYALTQAFLAGNPHSRPAARLLAGLAAQAGQWARARDILTHLVRTGGARDPLLLADLSLARQRAGDGEGARQSAYKAWTLQPASPAVAQAWALALSRHGRQQAAEALASRARAGLGDTALLAEVRKP